MYDFLEFFSLAPYYPEKWLGLRSIGILFMIALGFACAMITKPKMLHLLALAGLAIVTSMSSVTFDEKYIHLFEHSGRIVIEPVFGCKEYQAYLETLGGNQQPNYHNLNKKVNLTECTAGGLFTIFISCSLAFVSVCLWGYSLVKAALIAVAHTKLPSKITFHQSKNNSIEIESIPSSPTCQWRYEDLNTEYQKLLDHICSRFQYSKLDGQAVADFAVCRGFIYELTHFDEKFQGGFFTDANPPYCDIQWHSFEKRSETQSLGALSSKNLFSWLAYYLDTDLEVVLAKFVEYYRDHGENKGFFGDLNVTIDKLLHNYSEHIKKS